MCERCEELEEKVRQLKELLGVDETPPRYGLTASQWTVFQIIAARGTASYAFVDEAYNMTRREPVQPNTIKCIVHHTNKKLAKQGMRLSAVHSWGYKLEKINAASSHRKVRPTPCASRGDRPALLA